MLKKITAIILVLILSTLSAGPVFSTTIKVATYNLENLFDAHNDGTEYPDYVPGGKHGWNRDLAEKKTAQMTRVIIALEADILGLQEIESQRALDRLLKKLAEAGRPYAYSALADTPPTTVACGLISRYPVVRTKEILPGRHQRSILKATLNIEGHPLTIFVNHWKSRQGPESRRLVYARALKKEIDKLDPAADFIVLGDFNSNYNEHQTFRDVSRLNNTNGITGINHVLGTIRDDRLVDEATLRGRQDHRYLYNLWLELPAWRRWSHEYFGHRNSLDSIIVSGGLYDDQGPSYLDNSFDKFEADFLFHKGNVFRWQQADHGRGKHLGQGYSDHLPLYARFTTDPFKARPPRSTGENTGEQPEPAEISRLYEVKAGRVALRL
ncbi:MAG: endonuclease/exonuclease/phosphatase family protein, partial [Desulfosudaceae bacterium]